MAIPTIVEAITIPQYGDVEVIEKTIIPFKQNPGDLVVKIQYGGINFIDTYYRTGLYPFPSFPATLGKESTGTIMALPTDPNVLGNPMFKKQGFRIGGKVIVDYLGTFATYVSVSPKHVFPFPDTISARDATAVASQGLTALTFTEEAYAVKKGDVILVHTVAGGLGLLFAQIIKSKGAMVIGTTSSPHNAELAKAHGADHVILYPTEDTVQRVLELTNGQGVDAIFDGIGKDTFDNNFKMIKGKGTIVSVGNASGPVEPFSLLRLAERNVKIVRPTISNYLATPEEMTYYAGQLFKAVLTGNLKINIFKEYPFTAEGVKEAYNDLTSRRTTGKLLLKIDEDA